VKATVVSVRLRIYLRALINTNASTFSSQILLRKPKIKVFRYFPYGVHTTHKTRNLSRTTKKPNYHKYSGISTFALRKQNEQERNRVTLFAQQHLWYRCPRFPSLHEIHQGVFKTQRHKSGGWYA
jgi:hypothetical protein